MQRLFVVHVIFKALLFLVELFLPLLLLDPVLLLNLLHAITVAVALILTIKDTGTRRVLSVIEHKRVTVCWHVVHSKILFLKL